MMSTIQKTEQDRTEQSAEGTATEAPFCEWEQWEGETVKAFEAFKLYLSISPQDRSTNAAYRLTDKAEKVPKGVKSVAKTTAPGNWNQWFREWEWVERSQAYDSHQAQIKAVISLHSMVALADREIEKGKELSKAGEWIFKAVAKARENLPEDEQLAFMLEFSRIAKGPLDMIKMGSELEAQGHNRKLEAFAALAPDLQPLEMLSQEERTTLNSAFQVMLDQGKSGNIQALSMIVNSMLGK
jgi:hypothetical protein